MCKEDDSMWVHHSTLQPSREGNYSMFGLESLPGSLIAGGSSFIFWLRQKIPMGMSVTRRKSYVF